MGCEDVGCEEGRVQHVETRRAEIITVIVMHVFTNFTLLPLLKHSKRDKQ